MARAYGVKQVIHAKFKTLEFEGEWLDLIGKPESTGTWIIYGDSYNGKSSFSFQLAKYLTRFGIVAYNSLEEGKSETVRLGFQKVGMMDVNGKLLLLDKEPIDELKVRLRKKKSPRFIFIDSFQYAHLSYREYTELRDEFPHKIFIIISHVEGKKPKGTADSVRYDAHVKIWIEGFAAFSKSRYGGNQEPYIIWKEGYEEYYGDNI